MIKAVGCGPFPGVCGPSASLIQQGPGTTDQHSPQQSIRHAGMPLENALQTGSRHGPHDGAQTAHHGQEAHPGNKRMSGMFFDFKRCGNLVP